MSYPAEGAPEVAARAIEMLQAKASPPGATAAGGWITARGCRSSDFAR